VVPLVRTLNDVLSTVPTVAIHLCLLAVRGQLGFYFLLSMVPEWGYLHATLNAIPGVFTGRPGSG
jgi:hypothetical protein